MMHSKISILVAVALGALMTSAATIHGRQAAGTQFITGVCASDGECASGCCGFTSGKCAAEFVANERGEGCGFGDAQSNSGSGAGVPAGGAAAAGAANNAAAAPAPAAAAAATPAGTQFITGVCTGDVDCASGCCGFNSGKCAAVIPALERGEGCGFGGTNNEGPGTAGNPSGAPGAASGAAAAGAANNAAAPAAAAAPAPAAAAAGSGKPPGTQFITGPCASDDECASSCCGFTSGKCAAVIPALERGEGCGFGDAQKNSGPGTRRRRHFATSSL